MCEAIDLVSLNVNMCEFSVSPLVIYTENENGAKNMEKRSHSTFQGQALSACS